MYDVVTIGSATMDVFVESDEANIVAVYTKNKKSEFMSYPYGAKIEINDFASNVGGGGVNTAVNFANLGFKTSAVFKIGDDVYSEGILKYFKNKNVDLSNIIQDPGGSTGFSIILTSFQGDRTVLAHRGANADIKKSDINFDAIKQAKFLYIAPLNGSSSKIFDDVMDFAEKHGVQTCFNAGTTSIKKGYSYLKKVLETAEVVVMNKEEASLATRIEIRQDTRGIKYSDEAIHPDIRKMCKKLKINNPQVIVITDGSAGAYAYDGADFYKCPVFEGSVVSTLGAGDAFASTFCAALNKFGSVGRALMYASVNSAAAVSVFGATEGLITFDEIEKRLSAKPDYKYLVC
ncbi:MAG: carbohydrate kinase family protein [Heliobacteriaceae bacterium]|jgi:sugar/nucleoside kinase (ribokinase family)|nr:carbohydrate kinase family protein [Heliobacteriaceae bacterium]